MGLPGANLVPGFEGVVGTLETCSSQTSSFAWSRFSQQVRSVLLQRSLKEFQHHSSYRGKTVERLSTNILLTAMDYLYLVQSLPEDRKIILNSQEGMIPLIIWAHHIHLIDSSGSWLNRTGRIWRWDIAGDYTYDFRWRSKDSKGS